MEESKIMVLSIVNTHGLKGDVRALYYADGPDFFDSVEFVTTDKGEKLYLENVRVQKGALLVKFRGVDTPEAAEALRGRKCYVEKNQLSELSEGEYYIADLVGCDVTDGEKVIGAVKDVYRAGAGEMMEVGLPSGKTALIPFVEAFVKEVDLEKHTILVELIEGLIDEI